LFVQRWTGGENCQQPKNFFALGGISEREAHAHAKTGMGAQNLTSNFEFHVGGAD
jgi:hypothetical protein